MGEPEETETKLEKNVFVSDNYCMWYDLIYVTQHKPSNEIDAIAPCLALAAFKASLEALFATAPVLVAFAASSTSWLRLVMAAGSWWGIMANRLLWVGSGSNKAITPHFNHVMLSYNDTEQGHCHPSKHHPGKCIWWVSSACSYSTVHHLPALWPTSGSQGSSMSQGMIYAFAACCGRKTPYSLIFDCII